MKIIYKLDYSEPLNINDGLLGSIKITGSADTEIYEEYTFIESWFAALCEGFHNLNLKNENQCTVDIPEEPDPLIFIKKENVIKYGRQFVIIESFAKEERELHRAVKSFLSEIIKGDRGNLPKELRFLKKCSK